MFSECQRRICLSFLFSFSGHCRRHAMESTTITEASAPSHLYRLFAGILAQRKLQENGKVVSRCRKAGGGLNFAMCPSRILRTRRSQKIFRPEYIEENSGRL